MPFKKTQLFQLPSWFLILTCNHGGQKNYLLHMKAEICTGSHGFKSQGLIKNDQISHQNGEQPALLCQEPCRAASLSVEACPDPPISQAAFLLVFASSI